MRTAITAGVARATGWLVVVAVALATTIGLINRIFTPADAPYFLLTREVAAHPWASLGLLVVSFGAYGWVFRKLCGLLAGWRDGVHTHPPRGPRTATLVRFLDWMFSSWWRIALVLAVCWLPWYLTSYPGQPNPDFARMLEEFLLTRPDTVGATPAYENYPTSFYLLPGGDSLWSNHHNFFLMLYYGSVSKLSITLFGTVMPAIYALSTVTLILTLVAFGRAFAILGRFVTDWKIRGIGFGLVVFSPLIALWSMSHSKNQLFAAGFAWWLALLAEYLHAERRMLRRWYVEMVLVGVLITASVLFGWILLVCQAIAMLFLRRGWRGPLTAMAVPALVVHGAVVVLVSMGTVIPSDPIETKGLQLQQLTLILKEHPDALSAQDRAALSRIFDTDVMVEVFDPDSSDPVKSTGPFIRKTDSYQYKTVQPQDWDAFNGIYLRAALKYPGTFLDGLVLKTYRYLDPLDKGTTWYPAWQPNYDRSVGDYRIAPVTWAHTPRTYVRGAAYGCYEVMGCRVLISPTPRMVLVVLICAAAIAVGRRYAWFWSLPFALQLGVVAMSPLSAGGRYGLGFMYALGILIMVMAIPDRKQAPSVEPDPDERTTIGSRRS